MPAWWEAGCRSWQRRVTGSRALLDKGARHLRERGTRFTIKTESAAGDPVQVILHTATEDNAAVIILGSHLGATDPPGTSSPMSVETREPAKVNEERQLAPV